MAGFKEVGDITALCLTNVLPTIQPHMISRLCFPSHDYISHDSLFDFCWHVVERVLWFTEARRHAALEIICASVLFISETITPTMITLHVLRALFWDDFISGGSRSAAVWTCPLPLHSSLHVHTINLLACDVYSPQSTWSLCCVFLLDVVHDSREIICTC